MNVPFHKPHITGKEITEVTKCLTSGWLTMGPKTIEFEKKFKDYIGSEYALSVSSCTAALHLALIAVGITEGDEVLLPAFTFAATAEVVCYLKATPVFVDVEKNTHNINVSEIEKHITPKTKAIIPVHYGGQPCDMDDICRIAKKHGLYVIEDSAHSLPAWYKNRKIGTIGDITCFSFYATKTLTCGEGGMVTTNNSAWAKKIKSLRLHGISHDMWERYSEGGSWYYEVVHCGFKYNMTDVQAALGTVQLNKLEWMWEKRKQIAKRYTGAFQTLEELSVPHIKNDRETSWHLYPIKLNTEMLKINRNEFITLLKERGVNTSVHFIPLYYHPFYKKAFSLTKNMFPICEWIYERILSLPIYPGNKVIGEISNILEKHKK
ncbi:DegT/DnrJ/EryC1/StrS family aminotransferase [Candidatus Latescibacterota bacterium]